MVEELRGLAAQLQAMSRRNEALEVGQMRERQVSHAGEVAAKDETIATQREALATKDQALAADALAIASQAAPAAPRALEAHLPAVLR